MVGVVAVAVDRDVVGSGDLVAAAVVHSVVVVVVVGGEKPSSVVHNHKDLGRLVEDSQRKAEVDPDRLEHHEVAVLEGSSQQLAEELHSRQELHQAAMDSYRRALVVPASAEENQPHRTQEAYRNCQPSLVVVVVDLVVPVAWTTDRLQWNRTTVDGDHVVVVVADAVVVDKDDSWSIDRCG